MTTTTTVNVNLKPCDCPPSDIELQMHETSCASAPVRISCRIPPSVTFTVRLGECDCIASTQDGIFHEPLCRARPIRVTCSISGKDWPSSEVVSCEYSTGPGRLVVEVSPTAPAWSICRERWALVKALVLGHADLSALLTGPKAVELSAQRDAVYAALCEKVRAEQADDATTRAIIGLVPGLKALDVDAATARDYLSARALTAYVKRLIEQVGNLEGGK